MYRNRAHRTRRTLLASAAAALLAGTLLSTPSSTAEPARERTLPYRDASLPVDQRVADLLGRMSLEEKVGQMTQAERSDVDADPSLITEHALGSVLSGGGSVPTPNTPEAWADMVDRYQRAALETDLGIPLLYGVDSVHGHGNLQGATVFPHNIGLGATRSPRLVEQIAHATAVETRATGPQWAFAPCVCVARDDRWGRTYESFSEQPQLAATLGGAAIDGLQGRRGQLDDADRVLASAKHFAGDGLTEYGTGEGDYTVDQGIDRVSRAEFERLALAPYRPAITRHHVGSVMPSFSSVDWTEDGIGNPVKMHANRELVTDVLKGEMGFDGFVISDWRAIRQLPGTYADQVEASVKAGVDMFMEPIQAPNNPDGWDKFIPTLIDLVESGQVSEERIDDAVSRILAAKFELGLFEHPMTDRSNLDRVGSPAHHALARRAAAESQVLLRNHKRTLPLEANRKVYVAGSNADNIGNQAGGWTLTWQGGSTNVVPGTTILDGIEEQAHGKVTYSETAAEPVPPGADGVVVVGETPYAEGFGDVGGPEWAYDPGDNGKPRPEKTMSLSEADEDAVRTVCDQARSCTVLVVSGRPMVVPPDLLSETDALVASWLPGSEGTGVADVLYGRRPFTGKLPMSWPRAVDDPVNVGDPDYDPQFPFGFGLTARR